MKHRTRLVAGSLLMCSLNAWALSAQAETSMPGKAASDAGIAAANRAKAAEAAITSYYYSGLASARDGDLERGRFWLELYVRSAGANGQFTQNAMYQIGQIDARIMQRNSDAAAADKAAADKAAADKEAADRVVAE